jgi:hypothetical protein
VDFWVTDPLLIRFCIRRLMEKIGVQLGRHQLFIGFKKIYDSVRKEVLYIVFIKFGVSKDRVRLVKMPLKESCSRVRYRYTFF